MYQNFDVSQTLKSLLAFGSFTYLHIELLSAQIYRMYREDGVLRACSPLSDFVRTQKHREY